MTVMLECVKHGAKLLCSPTTSGILLYADVAALVLLTFLMVAWLLDSKPWRSDR